MFMAALVAAALLVLPAQAFAEKTIGLSSGTFKFEVAAGDTATGTVYVTNDGDENISVLLYVSDQNIDAKGTATYATPDRTDFAALTKPATWTSLRYSGGGRTLGNIPYVELTPGERRAVRFTIDVPAGTAPGDHNLLVFFEMFEQPAGGASKAVISGRIGARVTLRVKGTLVERMEVRPFEVPAFVIGNTVDTTFLLRNGGNTDRRVTADLLLLNGSGKQMASAQPIPAKLVFAEHNREASGTLVAAGSPIGPHTVRLEVTPVNDEGEVLDAGKDRITIERRVWLVPMWLIAAVVLFIVLIIGRAAVVVIGRRAEQKARSRRSAERRRSDEDEYEYPDADRDA